MRVRWAQRDFDFRASRLDVRSFSMAHMEGLEIQGCVLGSCCSVYGLAVFTAISF